MASRRSSTSGTRGGATGHVAPSTGRHELAGPAGPDRGNGVFVVGDMVAAPGLLSETILASSVTAVERLLERAASQAAPDT